MTHVIIGEVRNAGIGLFVDHPRRAHGTLAPTNTAPLLRAALVRTIDPIL